jgi:hypothetical protein
MPQLLYYLKVDQDTSIVASQIQEGENGEASKPKNIQTYNIQGCGLNWGTLDLYTCTGNCAVEGYSEEHVVIQTWPLNG